VYRKIHIDWNKEEKEVPFGLLPRNPGLMIPVKCYFNYVYK